jgi:hypothetical protein
MYFQELHFQRMVTPLGRPPRAGDCCNDLPLRASSPAGGWHENFIKPFGMIGCNLGRAAGSICRELRAGITHETACRDRERREGHTTLDMGCKDSNMSP